MNSLQDLNGTLITVEYSDDRPPAVDFNATTASNQSITFNEGQTHSVPVGIEIVNVIDYATCAVTYTINVSSLAGATVSWASLPDGVTLTTPSTGVYRLGGINSAYIWSLIKSPTITLPVDYYGSFSYTATINYLTTQSKAWTVSATVVNVDELSTASNFWYNAGANSITGNPTLVDVANPVASWVVTVKPTTRTDLVTTIASGGTGGTSSYDNSTKTLTINGTNTQINSHLNSLTYTAPAGSQEHFTFSYRATSLSTGESDTKLQNIKSNVIRYLGLSRGVVTFALNTATNFANGPLITDDEYDGSGVYTVTVTMSNTTYGSLSSAGSGGTSNFNTTTKVLTLVGTRTQVNSHINAMTFTPASNVWQDFTLTYNLVTPRPANTGTRTQSVQGPRVAVSPVTPTNQSVSISEGDSHVVPVGTNVIGVNGTSTLVTYTIDVSGVPGAVVTWSTKPTYSTVTNPSSGVYIITSLQDAAGWDLMKSPTITLPNAYNGTFTYTPTIKYDGATVSSWSVTVAVSDVLALSVPSTFNYYSGTTQTVTGNPILVDTGNQTPTWSVTVTPSRVGSVSTLSAGGTATKSFNSSTKVLTLTGTLTAVNSSLNSISIATTANLDLDFTLTYYASNTTNGEVQSRIQTLLSNNYSVLQATRLSESYTLNTPAVITNGPLLANNGAGYYGVSVVASPSNAISSMTGDSINGVLWGSNSSQTRVEVPTGSSSDSSCSVAVSADGNVVVIGSAPALSGYGVVYVRRFSSGTWSEVALTSDAATDNNFGRTVAISDDGNTIAIGAKGGGGEYGAFVFVYSGGTWSRQASLLQASFKTNLVYVSLSADGNTLAAGDQRDGANSQGAVYIFTRSGTTWSQQTKITLASPANEQQFGGIVRLSADGNTLAVGMRYFDQRVITPSIPGKAWVYTRSGTTWSQQRVFTADTSVNADMFGSGIAISRDGNRLAIASYFDSGASGSLYIFTRSGTTWTKQTKFNNSSLGTNNVWFGHGLAFDYLGTTLVVGVPIIGFSVVGKVFSYSFNGSTWTLINSLTPTGADSNYGWSVAVAQGANVYRTVIGAVVSTSGNRPTYLLDGNPIGRFWNAATQTLTINETLTNANTLIDGFSIVPTTGYTGNFELLYTGVAPSGATSQRNQAVNRL
jgi:hypothetical protein